MLCNKANKVNPMNCKYKKCQPTREEMPKKKCNATHKYQPESTQVDIPAQNLKKVGINLLLKNLKRKQTDSSTHTI